MGEEGAVAAGAHLDRSIFTWAEVQGYELSSEVILRLRRAAAKGTSLDNIKMLLKKEFASYVAPTWP